MASAVTHGDRPLPASTPSSSLPPLFSGVPEALPTTMAPCDLVALGRDGYRRPGRHGDPVDLTTGPVVPKPIAVVEMIEPKSGLKLEDRKLYNVLLALSWDRLDDPAAPAIFAARAIDLRRGIGCMLARDNRRLRQSMRRLMETFVTFERLVGGTVNEGRAPLLSDMSLPPGEGIAKWQFPAMMRPYLAAPSRWARLDLAVCSRFRSWYALVLYERLSLLHGLDHPYWPVTVEYFRRCVGTEDRLPGWDPLCRTVIEPALAEISEHAPFRAFCEPVRAAGTRRVERLVFGVKSRSAAPGPLIRPCRTAATRR